MPQSKNSPRAVAAAKNRARAVELRVQGWTLAEIGADLKVTKGAVSRMLAYAQAEFAAQRVEGVATLKAIELAALLEMRDRAADAWSRYEGQNAAIVVGSGVNAEVVQGEPIDAKGARLLGEFRMYSERIAKLMGLDAPELVVTRVEDMTVEEAERIIAEMGET